MIYIINPHVSFQQPNTEAANDDNLPLNTTSGSEELDTNSELSDDNDDNNDKTVDK